MVEIYLVRKEYIELCNQYEMEVNDELVACYNDYINKHYIFQDVQSVNLTQDDIIQAWQQCYDKDSVLNTQVIGYKYENGSTFMISMISELGIELRRLLSDDIWEEDSEEINYSTEMVEDFIDVNEIN